MKTKSNRNRRSPAARPVRPTRCARRHAKNSPASSRRAAKPVTETPVPPVIQKVAPPVPLDPVPAERRAYTGDSAFHLYIREIAQTKLLTPTEEMELAWTDLALDWTDGGFGNNGDF